MQRVEVNVTAEDIAEGVPKDAYNCPIAMAIHRLMPEADEVEVGGSDCTIDVILVDDPDRKGMTGGFRTERYTVPEWVMDRVGYYDEGLGLNPFMFEMTLRWEGINE